MKTLRAAVLSMALLTPSPLFAQATIPADTKLADVLFAVYAEEIAANINAGADPGSALSDLADALIITQAVTSQLSTFPLGSSAGGFTWSFMPGTGTFARTTESFGPLFAERALTIGKGRVNVGLNYQRTSFDSFEGRSLEDREIVFYTPFPSSIIGEDALELNLTTQTFGFFANYGVTDRLDFGVVLPVVSTSMTGESNAQVIPFGGPTAAHFFAGTPASPSRL